MDGDLDALIWRRDTGPMVFTNDGSGHFTPSGSSVALPPSGGRGHLGHILRLAESTFGDTVLLADWDRDGDLDVWGSGRREWLRNDEPFAFVAARASSPLSPGAESGDVNGDGLLDFVFPETRGSHTYLGVLVNQARNPSGEGTLMQGNIPVRADIASLGDLDGDLDLIASGYIQGEQDRVALQIWLNE
ncbi:MAG: VCBS repeat-containing protein [Deltaproteobacteria bacterium]|nr:VCBS repeat-containing protein [Deltaproteobacteria bacterium]